MSSILQKVRGWVPRGVPVLGTIAIVNLVLAFAREATVAYFFGTSSELDTFLVALALPSLLVVNIASISVAVVLPIYVGYREAGEATRASVLVHKWFWFSGLAIVATCLVLFVSSEFVMRLMANGLDSAQQSQAASWLRWLLPYVWLLGMVGVFAAVLNSNNKFAVPAASGPLISVCVMLGCAFGAKEYGAGVLAAGLTTGAGLVFVWQWLNSRKFEPRLPTWSSLHSDLALPFAAGGAMVLHSVALQLDVIVDRAFASNLGDGSIAAYNYARMLNSTPSALVTSVLSTALFPVLARMAAAGEWKDALRTVRRWSTALFILGFAPVVFLIAFREEVVSVVFQRGAFDEHAVRMTAEVLTVLPFMMIIGAVSGLFTQLLLAQQRTRIVAIIAVATIGTKIVLNFALVGRYGLTGLALATVVAATIATTTRVLIAWRYQEKASG